MGIVIHYHLPRATARVRVRDTGGFVESEHPRKSNGEFGGGAAANNPGQFTRKETATNGSVVLRRGNPKEDHWADVFVGFVRDDEIGHMEMSFSKDTDTYSVRESSVKEAYRGKGYGKDLYREAIAFAIKNKKGLVSDSAVSESADRVWEALQKIGAPVSRAPMVDFDSSLKKFYAAKTLTVGGQTIRIRTGKPVWTLTAPSQKFDATTSDSPAFVESEHPRSEGGEFARTAGATVARSSKPRADPKWTKHDGTRFEPHEIARLKALAVPPAWTRVHLHPEGSPLVVTGYDEKGRQQRRYSAAHAARGHAAKFARLKAFNAVATKIVTSARSDMNNAKLPQSQRDAAAVLKLISATGFRIGSTRDTGADVQAYGASTLTADQVKVKGSTVTFTFTGKSGVAITKTLVDDDVAKYLQPRLRSGGRLFNVSPQAIRTYLKSHSSKEFKVKDFRTWTGTNEALKAISTMPHPTNEKEFAAARLKVAKHVAEVLGNTPKVALDAYIDPAVFGQWRH